MTIFYLLIGPVIGVCLFILFVLSRHDFAILRRNITLVQIFDKVLIATVFGLFVGRFVYIINSGDYYLFHFLAFFHVLRNSGFSVFGFFLGLVVASVFFFRKSKIMFRMMDVVMLSFFPVAILNSVISKFVLSNIFINISVCIFLIFIFFCFLRLNTKAKVKDGFVATVLLIIVCIMAIVTNIGNSNPLLYHLSFSQMVAGCVLFLAISNGIYLQKLRKKK